MSASASQKQKQITALLDALKSAEDFMNAAISALATLEDNFPRPAPSAIEDLKNQLGDIVQNWTSARNAADQQLRNI